MCSSSVVVAVPPERSNSCVKLLPITECFFFSFVGNISFQVYDINSKSYDSQFDSRELYGTNFSTDYVIMTEERLFIIRIAFAKKLCKCV